MLKIRSLRRSGKISSEASTHVECFAQEFDAEEEAAQRKRLKAQRKDEEYVAQLVAEQEAIERKARAKRMREKNIPQRIIYQFTMDASGKTIKGSHDEDNTFHL